MSTDLEATIADLAMHSPYSVASLRSAVASMRRRAEDEERELREEWIPNLLRVAVDLRTAGVPSGEALIAILPRRER